jgi:hypothetical protein
MVRSPETGAEDAADRAEPALYWDEIDFSAEPVIAMADEVVGALGPRIEGRARHGEDLAALFEGEAGGDERSEHEELVARILDSGGAIVAEMPMGWEPRGRDFPRTAWRRRG